METLIRDLRFAWRQLAKRKMLTAAAIVCLALGIGATTVVYSLVDGILLQPLPYDDPDDLYVIWNRFPAQGVAKSLVSGHELTDLIEQSTVFETVTGFIPWYFNLTDGADPERLVGGRLSAAVFPMLGAGAEHGRTFDTAEERNGDDVALISHELFERRFGSDPSLIGRTVSFDERPYEVIGVMPEGFRYLLGNADVWVPLVLNPHIPRNLRGVQAVGRLAPGVSPAQAQAEMDAIAGRLATAHPDAYPPDSGYGISLVPLREEIVGPVRPILLALFGAVILVLLIACANVANLLLAQASTREREISVRAALGASRGALIRQVLTESVLLALLGGVLGAVLARYGLDAIKELQAANMPRLHQITVDARVLFFTFLASLATGLLFGLVPALRGTRRDLFAVLKEGGKTSADSQSHPLRHGLVIAQIALALVVLVGTGLMIRSFSHLQRVDPGFRTDGVLTAQLFLSRQRYPQAHQRAAFADQLLAKARAIPGVRAAGVISHVPLGPIDQQGEVTVEGHEQGAGRVNPRVGWRFVSPGYFETMRIPLLRGRNFTELDHAETAPVAMVDAALAARLWPDGRVLDRRIKLVGGFDGEVWRTVVGVVGSVRHRGLAAPSSEQIYVPFAQAPALVLGITLRTDGDPLALIPALRDAARQVDPAQPLANVKTADQLLGETLTQPRFHRLLFGLFGGTALILAAIGVYGVMAYAVAQRRREIGLRMALGARPADNLKMVLGQSLKLTAAGVAVGLIAAWLLSRALGGRLAGMIHGVAVTDLVTFAGVPLLLLFLALVASLLPARRATRVDPIESLRQD